MLIRRVGEETGIAGCTVECGLQNWPTTRCILIERYHITLFVTCIGFLCSFQGSILHNPWSLFTFWKVADSFEIMWQRSVGLKQKLINMAKQCNIIFPCSYSPPHTQIIKLNIFALGDLPHQLTFKHDIHSANYALGLFQVNNHHK